MLNLNFQVNISFKKNIVMYKILTLPMMISLVNMEKGNWGNGIID